MYYLPNRKSKNKLELDTSEMSNQKYSSKNGGRDRHICFNELSFVESIEICGHWTVPLYISSASFSLHTNEVPIFYLLYRTRAIRVSDILPMHSQFMINYLFVTYVVANINNA